MRQSTGPGRNAHVLLVLDLLRVPSLISATETEQLNDSQSPPSNNVAFAGTLGSICCNRISTYLPQSARDRLVSKFLGVLGSGRQTALNRCICDEILSTTAQLKLRNENASVVSGRIALELLSSDELLVAAFVILIFLLRGLGSPEASKRDGSPLGWFRMCGSSWH